MLATASFPCTDLSTAGLYKGFAGKHSSAFFGFTEVLRRLGNRRPPLVMLENVTGFLTARAGKDFADAAAELASLGYRLDVLQVDASHFVPQSRERVFVIGRSAEAFPRLGTSNAPESDARPRRLLDLVKRIPLATGWDLAPLPPLPKRSLKLDDVVMADAEQDWWPKAEVDRHVAMMSDRHLATVEAALMQDGILVAMGYRRIREKRQRLEVRFDGLAGCLRTLSGGSSRQIVLVSGQGKLRMRWMNAAEYALLQGCERPLPEERGNKLLSAFGDAVCVPVISWIGLHLLTPAAEMLTSRSASVA
jgi:DNA (cytosine-5)-methyltransferase 1